MIQFTWIRDVFTLVSDRIQRLFQRASFWSIPAMLKQTIQSSFISQLTDPMAVMESFEHIPGVFVLVKDVEGRFIYANTATCLRLGVQSVNELVGKKDSDFIPNDLVKDFRNDDLIVFKTRKPLLNRLEVWLDEQRQLQWFLTTKLPLKGKNGRCIGVLVIIRRHEEKRSHHTIKEVTDAVAFIRANLHRVLTSAELARSVGVSERNLYRKFQQTLGVPPSEVMLRIRTEAAAERLLLSNDPLSEIGLAHGFCDQSAFTRHFRKRTGLTPKQFRLRYQNARP